MNIVELRGITKRFGSVVANKNVSFFLEEGEIHTLLGENGAGKTTLMNILYGFYTPDEGEIYVKGKKVRISAPIDAINLGIGMVHQHFTLVPSFTVVENILLGRDIESVPNLNKASEDLRRLSEQFGLKVDPFAKVWQLSVGEMQRVEILKLLYRNVDVLILDEPTAVLTPQEADELFSTLRELKKHGKSIVFISHKLNEVMNISDRITVLKRGEVVGTVNKEDTSPKELAKMMVGREVILKMEKKEKKIGKMVLKVKDIEALNDKGLKALRGISLSVKAGEILGIAGVAGNGQKELAEVLSGLRKVIGGKIYIDEKDVTNKGTRFLIEMGESFIPEDRHKYGVSPHLSVKDNIILKKYRKPPFSKGNILNHKEIENYAKRLVKQYDVMTPSIQTPVKLLSGGNMQKLILARELDGDIKFILAFHPTRGLDIGATEFVYKKLLEASYQGAAILLIAGDLEEIFTLSDRVVVIYEGEIVGDALPKEENLEKIGLLMAGIREERSMVN